MFRPGAPIDEIERDVESIIVELVHELGTLADDDPVEHGADERAYIKAFSDVRANSDKDQAALLTAAVNRPNLAESLLYLNRWLDGAVRPSRKSSRAMRILVRLAMDGLWVSDILDPTRFTAAQRDRLTDILVALTYLTDEQVDGLTGGSVPEREVAAV
ncbi:hypothetical protein [Arthrobacter castelli]|uniref:hypothetical protein n=1 Tax=Arthrobacter castelli TaxID=271431 RepID=UPI00041DC9F3|nr:hypothetical protein [Arthrobacter castelli]